MVVAEIEDIETGCTYIEAGKDLNDCVAQYLFMFFGVRKYKILWYREEK